MWDVAQYFADQLGRGWAWQELKEEVQPTAKKNSTCNWPNSVSKLQLKPPFLAGQSFGCESYLLSLLQRSKITVGPPTPCVWTEHPRLRAPWVWRVWSFFLNRSVQQARTHKRAHAHTAWEQLALAASWWQLFLQTSPTRNRWPCGCLSLGCGH